MKRFILNRPVQVLLFLFLLFGGLYFAKPFLVPFTIALMLSLLLLPLCRRMERKISRGPASILSVLVFLGVVAGIFTLLGWQMSGLADSINVTEEKVQGFLAKAQQQISTSFGVPPEKQQQMAKEQQQKSGGSSGAVGKAVLGFAAGAFSILGQFVLVLVYMFMFLYFRAHFKKFILKATPNSNRPEAEDIMAQSGKTVVAYVGGLGAMIACLWVMYGIGFSIAGVKHALFFAVLCGVLEIVPFVGNITGTAITSLMALTQGGSNTLIGVLVTYCLVQFIQTYLLEPMVVGKRVNIHPAATIFVIVIGELVWGIPGMILAIPLLAITKIILDHIPPLQPYGYLIGDDDEKDASSNDGFMEKLKHLFGKKQSS